jgi:PAS domain-containing protein
MNIQEIRQINKREHFFNFFAKLSDGVIVVNQLGFIMYMSPIAERMFSVKDNEIMG